MIFPHAIPAFSDNYIWLIAASSPELRAQTSPQHTPSAVIIVDPGIAGPVIDYLEHNKLQPCAILITHHHYDHIDGIEALCEHYPLPVYGPANSNIPGLSHPLHDQDEITLDNGLTFRVIASPGHTLDHLSYYHPGMLFCGDTLFAAGCGRLFEGSPLQMFNSLNRLASLPDDTRIFCTHEYTLANLEFAHVVEPENSDISTRLAKVRQQRAEGRITLPSTLAEERLSNPFLRCAKPSVMAAASHFAHRPITDAADTFKVIRFWKDGWSL
jgi:hydroxyacylglutathione hydrolase